MSDFQSDAFLSYRSLDRPSVRKVYQYLKRRGLSPWFDEEEIVPGRVFSPELANAICEARTAVIFLSSEGLGSWQKRELGALISQSVKRDIPVIPTLLPGVEEIPQELAFLGLHSSVAFHDGIEDPTALSRLEWGITGRKPGRIDPKPIEPVNLSWTGDWFVNVGEGDNRTWADCRKYGFISAGQGAVYSNALKRLEVGSKVYAYISGLGYVGYGKVTKAAVPIKDFTVGAENKPLLQMDLAAEKPGANSDDLALSEWVIGVKWIKTFQKHAARRFIGAFANPNVVCKLRHRRTLEFLREEFECDRTSQDSSEGSGELKTNKDWAWFFNVGENNQHGGSWQACREYGFLSAGGGVRWQNAAKKLSLGDPVYAYVSHAGYVGYGEVVEEAVPIKHFGVGAERKPLLSVGILPDDIREVLTKASEVPDYTDWTVRVRWHKTRSKENAVQGVYASPLTVCRFTKSEVLEELQEKFV